MAYIGRQPVNGNYLKLDNISSQFNGTTTRFNLTAGGSPFYAGSSYALRVALGGVLQEPEAAYTIDQNQIVFASAPAALTEFYCVVLGTAIGINVPGDGTVSGSKLKTQFSYDDGLLYLDDTNNRIGINTENPRYALDVFSSGAGTTTLHVEGNARITGILSIGQGTVTIDGNTNTVTATNIVVQNSLSGSAVAGYATTGYVDQRINDLIDGAPGALNTLNELAAALNDDSNFATTVTNAIANQVSGVGIRTAGGTVGTGATILDFRGAGISTITVASGIGTINITGGGGGGSQLSISTTAPVSPTDGQQWFDTSDGNTYIWYASQNVWVVSQTYGY